jgi:hypothetical protein
MGRAVNKMLNTVIDLGQGDREDRGEGMGARRDQGS